MVELAALNTLLNFFYPPRCAGCESTMPLASDERICRACLARIERIAEPICESCGIPLQPSEGGGGRRCGRCAQSPPHFGKARAIALYRLSHASERGTLASIIVRHKYGLNQSLSGALAQCLGQDLPVAAGDYDVVVPVPLHRARLRWRGFNQAALLASAVARRLGCRLDVTTLVRTRATVAQTANDLDSRRRNVRNAFAVRHPAKIAKRRVLLVDDVMTTGATVDECARVLHRAGARAVDVFTLARVA